MNYQRNKLAAITKITAPSMTDQSQARSTDINIIVRQFLSSGQAAGQAGKPMYGDFTQLPTGLRDMIHMSRRLNKHRAQLPEQLKDISIDKLLTLTPAELTNILTPPAKEPAKEETK